MGIAVSVLSLGIAVSVLSLAMEPPLFGPLWAEESVVLGTGAALGDGVVTALVVVFTIETVELIA